MSAIYFWGIVVAFLAASAYIAARVCRTLKRKPLAWRVGVWVAVVVLDFGFFIGRALPSDWLWAGRVVYVTSTMWMPVVLYMSAIMLVLDFIRVLLRATRGHVPYHTPLVVEFAASVTALLLIVGHVNAVSPEETRYAVCTDKLDDGQNVTVALVSDIHMGYAVTRSDVERLVDMLNSSGADMVLISGDLIDGSIAPVTTEHLGADLARISAPMGVFASMGNHEYVDDDEAAERYLRGLGRLVLLRDQQTRVGRFSIIGRDDLTLARKGRSRLPLSSFEGADSLFTIVMDHQPAAIDEAVDFGADLMVSGHTHAGQIWPMNILTRLIYRLDYGFACYGGTSVVVTSGYGTWGPRVRIGTIAEVAMIDIKGTRERSDGK